MAIELLLYISNSAGLVAWMDRGITGDLASAIFIKCQLNAGN